LSRHAADGTGRVDYSLRAVVESNSPSWVVPGAAEGATGELAATLWRWVDGPGAQPGAAAMLEPGVTVGSCWPMQGSTGWAVLTLCLFLPFSLPLFMHTVTTRPPFRLSCSPARMPNPRQPQVIRLHRRIRPTHVTLEHADRAVVLVAGTAPRVFRLWGLGGVAEGESLLGEFTFEYQEGAKSLQTFELKVHLIFSFSVYLSHPGFTACGMSVFLCVLCIVILICRGWASSSRCLHHNPTSQAQHASVDRVRLEVLSNWGDPDRTCIYRLRVHGSEV
jgi:hypothetical protein